jgi:hypothetical protein
MSGACSKHEEGGEKGIVSIEEPGEKNTLKT